MLRQLFFPHAGARADTFDVDVAVVASLVVVLVAPAVVAVVAFADVAFHTDFFSAVVASFDIVGAALIFAVVAVVVVAAAVVALVTSLTFVLLVLLLLLQYIFLLLVMLLLLLLQILELSDILMGQRGCSHLSPQHYFCPSVKASECLVGFVCPSAFFDVAGWCHRVLAAPQDQQWDQRSSKMMSIAGRD